MEHFQLRIKRRDAETALIALIRKHTGRSLRKIKDVLTSGGPIIDVQTHHNTYVEFIETTADLLDSLEESGVEFRCTVDGVDEPIEYVRNSFEFWHEIGEEIANQDDHRESG